MRLTNFPSGEGNLQRLALVGVLSPSRSFAFVGIFGFGFCLKTCIRLTYSSVAKHSSPGLSGAIASISCGCSAVLGSLIGVSSWSFFLTLDRVVGRVVVVP